jgi:phosphocarrier protein
MIEETIKITNAAGLHARPAALFVQTAGKFTSDIWIEKNDRRVNAKSIMGLIALAVSEGEVIKITVSGDDESLAIKELLDLITSDFGE